VRPETLHAYGSVVTGRREKIPGSGPAVERLRLVALSWNCGVVEPVTQWVDVTWTKASRGAPGAALRNAVPNGFLLPVLGAPMTHIVMASERDDFGSRSSWEPVPAGSGYLEKAAMSGTPGLPRHGEVDIRKQNDDLHILLRPTIFGFPPRRRRPPAVPLKPRQWVRWVVNYRFSGYRGWSYAQVTMNVANGDVAVDVFLGEPTVTIDERASLF
jgi:hypothetical protein